MSQASELTRINTKITNKEELTSEDFAWMLDPVNFATLSDEQKRYTRLTYNDFLNLIKDGGPVTNFRRDILVTALSENNLNPEAEGKPGDDSNDYNTRLLSYMITDKIKKDEMWVFYHSVISKTNIANAGSIEKQVKDLSDNSLSELFEKAIAKLPEPGSAGAKIIDGKPLKSVVDNHIPVATPSKGNTPIKKFASDLSASVQEQCVLLNFIKEISDEYETTLKAQSGPIYNNLAHRIQSDTPDTILNTLIIGESDAANIFDISTGIKIDSNTPRTIKDPKTGQTVWTSAYQQSLTKKDFKESNSFSMTYVKGREYQDYREGAPEGYPWIGDQVIDIELNGTNPSTARSDIKINYNSEISSLYASMKDANATDRSFTDQTFIYISRQGENLQGQGQGRFFKNIYNVTDNKKCLFVSLKSPKTITTNSNRITYGFDLSLVKHEFNIKNEFALTEVKLEHRGFLESLLYEPYLDVMGGKDLLGQRKIIEQEIIQKMVQEGCTKEDIQEAQENLRLFNRTNLINYKSRIVKRLTDLNAISTLSYDSTKFDYLEGSVIPDKKNPNSDVGITIYGEDTEYSKQIKFFTFGDFVAVCMEMFTTDGFSKGSVVSGYSNVGKIHGQKLEQFYDYSFYRDFKPVALMTPFRFKPRGGDVININIANLPISLSWFAKFMDDMYFKKKVEHIPIGQIFRDLLEIGISNMLSEVCFNNYIEKKLMFRVTAHIKEQNLNMISS